MTASLSFLLLAIFIIIYSLIIEVFTILFRLTGLTSEIARMQVVSLLTNSGFTTRESEVILASAKRRRLAQLTMLFGYSFTVIIVSAIVNAFFSLSQTEVFKILPITIISAASVLLVLFLFRLAPIHNALDHFIERAANYVMFGKQSNVTILVDSYGDNAIISVLLEHVPKPYTDVPLNNMGLREQLNIQVLHIKRGKHTVPLDGDTMFQQGDRLLLFGTYKNIRTAFEKVSINGEQPV